MSGYTPPHGFDVAFRWTDAEVYLPPKAYEVIFDFTDYNVLFDMDFSDGAIMTVGELPVDLGTISFSAGSILEVEISPWELNWNDGSTFFIDGLIVSNIVMSSDNYEGSTFELVLQANKFVSPDMFEGDETVRNNGSSWFTTRPAQDFSNNMYTGESASVTLETTINFGQDHYEGDELNVVLTTRDPILFDLNSYTGESLELSTIQKSVLFGPDFYDGGSGDADLQTAPGAGLQPVGYTGESLEVDLTRYPQFVGNGFEGSETALDIEFHPAAIIDPSFFDGDTGAADLATSTTVEASGYEGDTLTAILTTVPPPLFSLDFWDGDTGSCLLNTTVTLQINYFTGEENSVVLTTNPQPELLLEFWDGDTALSGLSTAPQLGIINGYTGESVSSFALDIEPPIFFWEGDSLSVELGTETSLPLFGFEGATATLVLDTRPSAGMGTFGGSEGSTFEVPTIWTLRSVSFGVLMRHSQELQADIDSGTYFDLTTDYCCGPRDNSGSYIDIGLADEPSYQYSGSKTIFDVVLSARPRFSFDMFEGGTATLKDYSAYLSVDFSEGSEITTSHETIQNIRLCKGNFIPNADHVDVELVYTYDENCGITVGYHGEHCDLDFLETTIGIQPQMYTGETMFADFVYTTGWSLNAYEGATFQVIFNEIPVRGGYEGSTMDLRFFEPDWIGADGATMTLGNLVTEYDVKFVEIGCLDNEYVPQTENGDPDYSKFNPVPVELDTFYHELKAICF